MSNNETRDKFADEWYALKGHSKDTKQAYIESWDACKKSDPDVLALVEALIGVIDKVGLTHYEDCDHYDDAESLCSCGVHKFEMSAREALAKLKEGK